MKVSSLFPWTKPGPRNKWLAVFKLEEALDREGCPICSLTVRASYEHLDMLYYEG